MGRAAIITGADWGIGRAVAIAFAREGADVLISYLDEHEDAERDRKLGEGGRAQAVLVPGDIKEQAHCLESCSARWRFGHLDICEQRRYAADPRGHLQRSAPRSGTTPSTPTSLAVPPVQSGLPHLSREAAIINTTSINAKTPASAAGLCHDEGRHRQLHRRAGAMVAEEGIRVNCVAPGPIWTPLIPSTMPQEKVKTFGEEHA